MMKNRKWTQEEKKNILKESKFKGIRVTLREYKISSSQFYEWEKRFAQSDIGELANKKIIPKRQYSVAVKNEAVLQKRLAQLEDEIQLYKEMTGKFNISDIPVDERIGLVRKYSHKGIRTIDLLKICKVTKRQYYPSPTKKSN